MAGLFLEKPHINIVLNIHNWSFCELQAPNPSNNYWPPNYESTCTPSDTPTTMQIHYRAVHICVVCNRRKKKGR